MKKVLNPVCFYSLPCIGCKLCYWHKGCSNNDSICPSYLISPSDLVQVRVSCCIPRLGTRWTLCVPAQMPPLEWKRNSTESTWSPEVSWRAAPSTRRTRPCWTVTNLTGMWSSHSSSRSSAPTCGAWSSSKGRTITSPVSPCTQPYISWSPGEAFSAGPVCLSAVWTCAALLNQWGKREPKLLVPTGGVMFESKLATVFFFSSPGRKRKPSSLTPSCQFAWESKFVPSLLGCCRLDQHLSGQWCMISGASPTMQPHPPLCALTAHFALAG